MEKRSIISMFLGTFTGILFALGMCMSLIPVWHLQTIGIVLGAVGLFGGFILTMMRRWFAGQKMVPLTLRTVLLTLFGIVAAIVFGFGMVLSLISSFFLVGIGVGILGIVMILSLIVMIKGSAHRKAE